MASINKVLLIGNVGDEPRIIDANNSRFATISLATTKKGFTKRDGTQVSDKTEWHRLTVFGKLVDVVEKYVHKGSQLYAEGELSTSTYKDKDGIDRKDTKVIVETIQLLGSKPQNNAPNPQPAPQQYNHPSQAENVSTDGDLPF